MIKDSWKYLPLANEFYLVRDMIYNFEGVDFYMRAVLTALNITAATLSISKGSINPKDWDIRSQKNIERTEDSYDALDLFKGAKNDRDSINIYLKHGFPIKLLEPSIKDKERAVKQGILENKISDSD